jgi:hypothetical protein
MSSWERARYIPWDRIPEDGTDLDSKKERIFREIQRETIQDELMHQERHAVEPTGGGSGQEAAAGITKTKIPYSGMELVRQAAFGGCIGSITGAVFGFMDGMRSAGESKVLLKASNMAKVRYLMQGTTRSATVFGVFFGAFHVIKYGIRVSLDPGDIPEIGMAGAASMGGLMYFPAYRASVPYAAMLVGMDGVNHFMRKTY